MLLIFFLLWLLFNMRLTLEIAVIGGAIALAVHWFCRRHMGYSIETDKKIVRGFFRGVHYVAVLIWETVKANIQVSRFVFSRTIEIAPRLIFFRTRLRSEAARVALANSITLTPGTITVALHGDVLCVHCLSGQMAEGIDRSAFIRLLEKMEEEVTEDAAQP